MDKKKETVDFISQIPTILGWNPLLGAAVSDYIIIARRKRDAWYIGAMTDWTARDFPIELSFLWAGRYEMKCFADGINAAQYAPDYKI